jgi:hypothetical protein
MVSTFLVLTAVLGGLGLTWTLVRSRRGGLVTAGDWENKRHDIDVQVFRVLLDEEEEDYMRRSLSRDQFDSFQRRRIRLAIEMLRLAEENARMLIGLGQLARTRSDSQLTRRANELILTAIQFRMNLISARFFLYLKWLLPHSSVSIPPFDLGYRKLLESLAHFQQLAYQN